MTATKSRLEHKTLGSGEPAIVFLNGFRMNYASWGKVYPDIADKNRVLLFNRPGVGRSFKATAMQDGEAVIRDMRDLLAELNIRPPYWLVAHSLGGLFANLFARRYPEQVAGLAFVESSHPSEIYEQRKYRPPLALHILNEGLKTVEKWFDPYRYSEDECVDETIKKIFTAGPFPAIPVAVVTGSKKMPFVPEAAFQTHLRYQSEFLELSPGSKHYLCQNSGHFPQVTEPDVVISAIRALMKDSANGEA